jgi:hypothetical protein
MTRHPLMRGSVPEPVVTEAANADHDVARMALPACRAVFNIAHIGKN